MNTTRFGDGQLIPQIGQPKLQIPCDVHVPSSGRGDVLFREVVQQMEERASREVDVCRPRIGGGPHGPKFLDGLQVSCCCCSLQLPTDYGQRSGWEQLAASGEVSLKI